MWGFLGGQGGGTGSCLWPCAQGQLHEPEQGTPSAAPQLAATSVGLAPPVAVPGRACCARSSCRSLVLSRAPPACPGPPGALHVAAVPDPVPTCAVSPGTSPT